MNQAENHPSCSSEYEGEHDNRYRRWYAAKHRARACIRHCALLALVATALAIPGSAQAQRGPEVTISPNAIQKHDVPMTVNLVGAPGETVHLFVLQSCDRNPATPELASKNATCKTPLWRKSVTLDAYGRKRTEVLLSRDVPGALPNKRLWLRASSDPAGRRQYQDAVFGWVGDPCSLWKTFAGIFAGDRCPIGAKRAVGPQRGVEDLPDVPLEVRRMVVNSTSQGAKSTGKAISVPGTHNATGVAWQDENTLLVTIRRRSTEERLLEPKRPGAADPGLYRFDLKTGKREKLLTPAPGYTFLAPIAVDKDCIVVMSQGAAIDSEGNAGFLMIWRHGKIIRKYPMRRTLMQMISVDPKTMQLVAYSRWRRNPAILLIDLSTGQLTDLGFTPHLYHAAMHSPRDPVTALALEDNATSNGWEIVLVDDKGELADELAVGPGHNFLPAWRKDGGELAYIGQTKGR